MADRTACPNCHERYVNVVRHLKRNRRCHRAVDEGRVLVQDFLRDPNLPTATTAGE